MQWKLHDMADFHELKPSWDRINRGATAIPILDSEVFQYLLAEAPPRTRRIAVCTSDGEPVAAAILERRRPGIWGTFQPSQAPLGAWVQKPAVPVQELMASLQSAIRGTLLLSLSQLDPSLVERPRNGADVQTVDYIDTARLTIEGTFEDYWEGRGKNLRKNLKRQRNLLKQRGVETRLERLISPDTVAPAVDDYGILESMGWKAGVGTAVHPSNSQGRFYRALLEAYSARGEAVIYRYFYDSILVATDLCLLKNRVLVLLKTTYDERETTTSPSYLLRQEVVKELFDDNSVARVEFYGRVLEWHTRWTSDFRRLYHVNRYRWNVLGRLAAARRRAHPFRELER